ncbi:uncharacterized protein [Argopecten irradians]|uniref:uncharacterized protein n=1 Tax=Argopecten irradians TaxID=31199 RepID=UPI003710ED6A
MTDQTKDVEAYGTYLRTKMGESLTDAVTQVIEKRPRDPIDFLATALYKSRNMTSPSVQVAITRRLQMPKWTPGETGSSIPQPGKLSETHNVSKQIGPPTPTKSTVSTKSVPCAPNRTTAGPKVPDRANVGYVLGSTEDADEDYDMGFGGPTVYVHQTVLSSFSLIGDMFDDDRIS